MVELEDIKMTVIQAYHSNMNDVEIVPLKTVKDIFQENIKLREEVKFLLKEARILAKGLAKARRVAEYERSKNKDFVQGTGGEIPKGTMK